MPSSACGRIGFVRMGGFGPDDVHSAMELHPSDLRLFSGFKPVKQANFPHPENRFRLGDRIQPIALREKIQFGVHGLKELANRHSQEFFGSERCVGLVEHETDDLGLLGDHP